MSHPTGGLGINEEFNDGSYEGNFSNFVEKPEKFRTSIAKIAFITVGIIALLLLHTRSAHLEIPGFLW